MSQVPLLPLNHGPSLPRLGLGVYQVPPERTAEVVRTALEAGYRSVDTAAVYGNERGVGEAVRSSGIPRAELHVTTKLWNTDQGPDSARTAFEASLARLGLDYVDLYLIHWPVPALDRYVETWRTLEKLRADGRVKAIGVSNFQVPHLRRLIEETGTVPAVNQIELHPYLQQARLRAFHAEHGIATQAWSPLGQGLLLDDPVITELAGKHGRTPAQVMLRWNLQLGNAVVAKSADPGRLRENLAAFDFDLPAEDLALIATLHSDTRTGPRPDTFTG
ncbi:aldo/keto reductase [Allostreptomyces psammosilenae]|uniref:Diketogulonate reductase-like aldo/keto reductase n=1 Tax=Allostreptomyces psammosilenae TaxID=1892865 RepID=A0A852ZWV9_9ACTN|nr:aldo/keto reductase [Allostreptomyces psammosilenae]NYI06883.1 diketogulonate reductase-like aldo/keto reductase [Allostreptomyces psammosilenae]